MKFENTKSLRLESLESRVLMSTYFVSNSGSDNGDGSASSPWQTLQHAANSVQGGDFVDVKAGTYAGFEMTSDHSGSADARITFHAEPGVVVNRGPNTTRFAINLEGASYVTIEQFTVRPDQQADSGIRSVANDGAIIRNNTIDGATWWGVLTGFSPNVQVINNLVTNTHNQHGIYVSNSGDNPIVSGNVCINNKGCGIQINGDAEMGGDGIIRGALVENNRLQGNGWGPDNDPGMNFDGVQSALIRNNIIADNRGNGMSFYQICGGGGSSNNTIVNNTIICKGFALNIQSGDRGAASGNQISNNILLGNAGSVLLSSTSVPGTFSDNNVVYDNFNTDWDGQSPVSLDQWRGQMGMDTHSQVVSTPSQVFVDPGGFFQLKKGSPAIGTGTSHNAQSTDYLSRPRNGQMDIGAMKAA